jgi:aminoglycoside phosphotransferase (APT) family kinase protein
MAKDDYTINLHKEFNFPLDILRDYIYTHTNIKYFRDEKIYDYADTDYIEQLLHEHQNLKISPVLCHADYHPNHILGEKHINAVIDWGDFQGGSGYIDLVNFQMYSEAGHFDKFLKGYGEIDESEFLLNKVHTILWEIIESEDKIRKAYEQELLNTIKLRED